MILPLILAVTTLATQPKTVPYQPVPCAMLKEQLTPGSHLPSEQYGEILAASLHLHGFDVMYPNIQVVILQKAWLDWQQCFNSTSPPTAATAPRAKPKK